MRTVAETCPQPRSWFAGTRKPAAPALPPWSLLRGRSKQAAAGPARTDHRHAGSVAPQLPAQRTAGHLASPVCSSSPQQTSTMLLTRVSALIQVNSWQIWLFPGTRLRADPWPARAGNGACRRTRRSSGDLRVPPVWGHQHAATPPIGIRSPGAHRAEHESDRALLESSLARTPPSRPPWTPVYPSTMNEILALIRYCVTLSFSTTASNSLT